MALQLPDFTSRRCAQLDICGHVIVEDDKPITDPPRISQSQVARYRAGEREVTIGLLTAFPSPDRHVHFRLAVPDKGIRSPPQPNCTTDEILKLVEPYLGSEIDANITGIFRVGQADFPFFIRSTNFEAVLDRVQVSMVGGTLAVRGAPVHKISWKLIEDGSRAEVTLEARTRLRFDGPYLRECLNIVESAFAALVVREHLNA